MFASNSPKRLLIAFLPLVLIASLLSSETLFGQNGNGEGQTLAPVSESILPGAVVSVLGDGFLGSPTVAPVSADACRASHNGPVEQAAREILDTVVTVENLSCPGSEMAEVVRDQLPQMRADTDVVVVGGLGLEFDFASLASACLTPQTQSISGCQEEAGLARASASNSFVLWRSFLEQSRRIAPDATIVIVAPPVPVTTGPNVVGQSCCGASTDSFEQVRSAFDVARALRQAVVEADESPLLLIETDVLFNQHRLDDDAPWLQQSGMFIGTPNDAGTAALADLLGAIMPSGTLPDVVENTDAQVALVLGAATSDRTDHEALAAATAGWFEQFEVANANPQVLIVSATTSESAPEPEPEPEREPERLPEPEPIEDSPAPSEDQEENEDQAVVEPPPAAEQTPPAIDDAPLPEETLETEEPAQPNDVALSRGLQNEPEAEVPAAEELRDQAVPLTPEPVDVEPVVVTPIFVEPVTVGPVISPGPLTTSEAVTTELSNLATSDGVTTLDDLAAAIISAGEFLDGPTSERSIIVRAGSLVLPVDDDGSFAEILSGVAGQIEIIAPTVEMAASVAEFTTGSQITVSSADTADLANALPAPDPVIALTNLDVANSYEFVLSERVVVQANVTVSRPTSAEVIWSIGESIVGVGQRAEIDTTNVGEGQHTVIVEVTTDREQLRAVTTFNITLDGDGLDDAASCGSSFDENAADIDGDGLTQSCDPDDDGDGISDAVDPCPQVTNATLSDADLDGLPNACDAEPLDGPAADFDRDGFPDATDNCPTVASDFQYDSDADGIGNACEGGTVNPICTITGTPSNDRLIGTNGNDVICAFGGNDTILGFGGDDIIFGGSGDDRISAGSGDDRVFGGTGNDEIEGNGGDDLLLGEGGSDTIDGGFGTDTIDAGLGADEVDGGAGADLIFGGYGADDLSGGDGADIISGGPGADTVAGEAGADRLIGGPQPDTVLGGRGDDVLISVGSNDFVRGGSETDLIDDGDIRVS